MSHVLLSWPGLLHTLQITFDSEGSDNFKHDQNRLFFGGLPNWRFVSSSINGALILGRIPRYV